MLPSHARLRGRGVWVPVLQDETEDQRQLKKEGADWALPKCPEPSQTSVAFHPLISLLLLRCVELTAFHE